MRSVFLAAALLMGEPALAGPVDHSAALLALARPDAVLIDVRTSQEFAAGALPGAHPIPLFPTAEAISAVAPANAPPIAHYCRRGRRPSLAQDRLLEMGYRQVINAGGYRDFGIRLAER